MNGRRVYNTDLLCPGDYVKIGDSWLICVPNGLHGTINNKIWNITEHEDGTITISPSILISIDVPDTEKLSWHGYLEKGIWREC
jgi:hypothetical protein